jgi:hypothetical protein
MDKIDQINEDKLKLEALLQSQKDIESKKTEIRSDAIR